MASTGLDVFDRTLQITNIWLDEIMEEVGPDRQVAWHMLSATLRTLRDRVPLELAAHFGAQLPLLVRGVCYDQQPVRDFWPLEETAPAGAGGGGQETQPGARIADQQRGAFPISGVSPDGGTPR
jgi:uncharacterized protein (DUF2267 family)